MKRGGISEERNLSTDSRRSIWASERQYIRPYEWTGEIFQRKMRMEWTCRRKEEKYPADFLGTVQTVKAEQSLQSLKKLSGPEAKVLRDGSAVQIPARELVIGDVILLEAGDMIPADGRLIENASLKVDESALTISCRTVSRSHNSGLHVCCYIEYIKNAICAFDWNFGCIYGIDSYLWSFYWMCSG